MSVPPRPDLRFLCAGRRANVGANVGANFGAVAPALLRVSESDFFALADLRMSVLVSVSSRPHCCECRPAICLRWSTCECRC